MWAEIRGIADPYSASEIHPALAWYGPRHCPGSQTKRHPDRDRARVPDALELPDAASVDGSCTALHQRDTSNFPGESIPGIVESRRLDTEQTALGDMTVTCIRTPMRICDVKKDRISWFRRRTQIRFRGVMTGQRPVFGFFFNVSIRSRLTV